MTHKFETLRLLLIPTSEKDSNFIYELMNSPKWIRYIGDRNIESVNDAKEYIKEKIIPQFEKTGFGTYTVIKKSDKSKIGTCGLFDRDGLEGIDLGFAFLPEFERNGFAFEASNLIMQIAFDKFNLNEIKAITTRDNISSQKLLEKLDFVIKGTTKLPNNSDQLLVYKRTK